MKISNQFITCLIFFSLLSNLYSQTSIKAKNLLDEISLILKNHKNYQFDFKYILENNQAVIEYIDTSESETALVCVNDKDIYNKPYTHMEIHPSLILGVMGNQVIFPENNPLPRDLFSCGQSKQAISIYHTNYNSRFDKVGVVLNYGQLPIVKSRYFKYINNEEHAYGINAIVAIACYGGYNVEDAVLFNKASLDRGLFRNTYYNTYETREDSSKVGNSTVDSRFANIEKINIVGTKPGYDYSDLDDDGLVKENTLLDDKKVLIGKVLTNLSNPEVSLDSSIFPKKGQLGYVDKTFITEGEEGFRIAKVRVRDDRTPAIGDKFCSRCGQKGTVGLVIDEKDMPFTEQGIRPDIIINPHALPSRMTIGQLLETVMGKAASGYGAFAECTAFNNNGSKYKSFGKLLTSLGYSSTANELLYNGQSGEQMQADVFIGPTYYMRLKQLVKDKINFRAKGPRTVLTRQTVQGRANDGGLRVGEQERDAIVGHGLSYFLQESLLVRGDEYFMAICNVTGMIAIHNTNLNLFMSPFADGPIKYVGELDDTMKIDKITKFGRSFSIVRVPYAFKLLIQELSTLNINIRIITEDNIEQISSMSFGAQITGFNDKIATPISTLGSESEYIDPLSKIDDIETILDQTKLGDDLEKLQTQQLLEATDGINKPPLNDVTLQDVGFDELSKTQDPGVNSISSESELPSLPSSISSNEVNIQPETNDKLTEVPLDKVVVVDDPDAPDELEEDNLELLTDIQKELDDEEEKESVKKVVSIK